MPANRLIRRPLRLEDAERMAETATAITVIMSPDERHNAQTYQLSWEEPGFDLADSSIGYFAEDSELAAYAVLYANRETPVHPWLNWGVHPDFRGQGLSAEVFAFVDEKAQMAMERCPPHARVSIRNGTIQGYTYREEAMRRAGYVPFRKAYDMRIDMTERPASAPMPQGIALRQYKHPRDLPVLVDVVRDSFSDHFGFIEQTFETDLEEFRHWFANDENFDPELVLLAADETTGQVVGSLLGLTNDHRYPGIGYIDIVGVRASHRRRGLAGALLTHSFGQFYDRGTKTVSLGVDGESLTNAVALYERVGMRIFKTYVEYEKVLRDGIELAKTSLE